MCGISSKIKGCEPNLSSCLTRRLKPRCSHGTAFPWPRISFSVLRAFSLLSYDKNIEQTRILWGLKQWGPDSQVYSNVDVISENSRLYTISVVEISKFINQSSCCTYFMRIWLTIWKQPLPTKIHCEFVSGPLVVLRIIVIYSSEQWSQWSPCKLSKMFLFKLPKWRCFWQQ